MITLRAITLAGLAMLGLPANAQTVGEAVADLVIEGCFFETARPGKELPRAFAAFDASNLPVVTKTPTMGFYGEPGKTYAVVNFTDDEAVACSLNIIPDHMNEQSFTVMVDIVDRHIRSRLPNLKHSNSGRNQYDYVSTRNGVRTAVTMRWTRTGGTEIASVGAPHED
ncbi:MAG: hypothetical protein AAF393_02660 [Pseudomonadota bacterium]